jgi:transcriptional regulator with XRE-family HTH domain
MTVTDSRQYSRWPSPPDPGDLSKRVARRRAELRLSTAQLAARTGMSRRYLEYLERYPARPTPDALRHLAAALRTTPAHLLGGGSETPPGQLRLDRAPEVTRLSTTECRRLIAPGGIGRIAFCSYSGPAILPVNFAVLTGTIVIRTSEGTAIEGHSDSQVAFEVDHVDDALCQGWSVLVRGQAHRVRHPAELHRVHQDTQLWPWPGDNRDVYLRIVPDRITGRRIEVR